VKKLLYCQMTEGEDSKITKVFAKANVIFHDIHTIEHTVIKAGFKNSLPN